MRTSVTFCLVWVAVAYGYQTGAPTDSCGDMMPQHGKPGQTSPLPYNVGLSKSTIKGGDTLSINIKGADKKFKGFFVQVRIGDTPIGKFVLSNPGVKIIDCGTGKSNAATHSKPDDKSSITLDWTAPPNISGRAYVYATVAENGGVYWVRQKTASLKIIK